MSDDTDESDDGPDVCVHGVGFDDECTECENPWDADDEE